MSETVTPYPSQQKWKNLLSQNSSPFSKISYQAPFKVRLCMLNYSALSRGDGGPGHPTLRPYCQMPGGFCPRESPAGGDQQVSSVLSNKKSRLSEKMICFAQFMNLTMQKCNSASPILFTIVLVQVLAVYAPVIYTAPCIMFWMRAYPLRGQAGGAWALEIESFFWALWNGNESTGECH